MRNLLCDSDDLHNEAHVEALFVERLLQELRYPDNRVRRKAAIEELAIPTGARTEKYRPDFVLMDSNGLPVVVIDAKHPDETPSEFRYQVTGYSLLINQRHRDNPVRYCLVTNGFMTELLQWDREAPLSVLRFENFMHGDQKFADLRSAISYDSFNQEEAVKDIRPRYHRPTIAEVVGAFEEAHQVIWKKEKIGPTKAFYELAKLLFVKLRQDKNIHEAIDRGDDLGRALFYMTRIWVNSQPTPNPVAEPLFRSIQTELEEEILSRNKKRIFVSGESIDLKPSTILEVVGILEDYDLHGIDEDLNGRMFETFLNATVRGKELGQFFTPRPVVKYMTRSAQLDVRNETIPKVIDACCGSGGFLIEALAELSHAIDALNQTNVDKEDLRSVLETDSLYGIEANDEIGRVARLNMYLHGDGGSRIYIADALDKELEGERGLPSERRQQLDELRGKILEEGTRFDVALTNPPFSMSYKHSDREESRILRQYGIARGESSKSNVLFLERYRDLLVDGGELLTVIDDSVLNGIGSGEFRKFILDNFIIRQIVSLPFNTFYKAQAGSKTSILHLRRKRLGEQQGPIFMAIANNVGHNDRRRDTPDRDNLFELVNLFLEWNANGGKPNLFRVDDSGEPLGCPMQAFSIDATDLKNHRFDAFYYAPDLRQMYDRLERDADAGRIVLRRGSDFPLVRTLSSASVDDISHEMRKYIDITSVTRSGIIGVPQEDLVEDLPNRARVPLAKNDVLFAKNISSRGTAMVVPDWLDGHLATTGFLSIRPETEEDALILWSVFRSEIWRKQVYYLSITSTQPEIRDSIFQEEMVIPWPATTADRARIVESARTILATREEERRASESNEQMVLDIFDSASP